MIYLIISLTILLAVCLRAIFKLEKYSCKYGTWQCKVHTILCPFSFLLGILVVLLPIVSTGICYVEKRDIRKIETTRRTIEESRKNNSSDLERAALIQTIIKKNERIAELRKDSKHWFWSPVTAIEAKNLEFLK